MSLDNIKSWLSTNTFQLKEFDLKSLEILKKEKGYTVAVVIPTLEEEDTIGNILSYLIQKLIKDFSLIDELIVLDGGSKDKTEEVCEKYKDYVKFYNQHEILKNEKNLSYNGKGSALHKGLFVTNSDIVTYMDADIKNFDERFVVGIIGPCIKYTNIKFMRGYYKRPYMPKEGVKSDEGGRVTELCARPLLNLLYPELGGFIQPLGGEYGGFRDLLEDIEYTSGYGVEVQTLIEIYEKFGLSCMGQTNMIERIHRHQPLASLSKMSFAIQQTILKRHIDKSKLSNSILIKNIEKENNSFVKSRSKTQVHCNCSGEDINNINFKYAEINENLLPKMTEIKEKIKNSGKIHYSNFISDEL